MLLKSFTKIPVLNVCDFKSSISCFCLSISNFACRISCSLNSNNAFVSSISFAFFPRIRICSFIFSNLSFSVVLISSISFSNSFIFRSKISLSCWVWIKSCEFLASLLYSVLSIVFVTVSFLRGVFERMSSSANFSFIFKPSISCLKFWEIDLSFRSSSSLFNLSLSKSETSASSVLTLPFRSIKSWPDFNSFELSCSICLRCSSDVDVLKLSWFSSSIMSDLAFINLSLTVSNSSKETEFLIRFSSSCFNAFISVLSWVLLLPDCSTRLKFNRLGWIVIESRCLSLRKARFVSLSRNSLFSLIALDSASFNESIWVSKSLSFDLQLSSSDW